MHKALADDAYFCVHPDKGGYYGLSYLDWQQAQYAGRT